MRPSKIRGPAAASPTAIQTFNFHGDELAVVPDGRAAYVVVRRVCEALGVSYQGQIDKLKADPSICLKMILTQMPGDDQAREVACVEVRSLPLWLATIHPSKVKQDVRAKLVAYKLECADVLADHFIGKRAVAPTLDATAILAALDKVLAPVMAAIAAQNDRLAALEDRVRDNGILAVEKVNAVKARVVSCAADLAKCGLEKRRAASLRIHKRLKMRVGWFGDHCRLDNMPARHEAEMLRELEIIEHETRGKVESARQLRLPNLTLVGNANSRKNTG